MSDGTKYVVYVLIFSPSGRLDEKSIIQYCRNPRCICCCVAVQILPAVNSVCACCYAVVVVLAVVSAAVLTFCS